MYAVTFVPDATGKDGAFSVVETEQLQHEHMTAFLKMKAGMESPLCERAELILFISANEQKARDACSIFQASLRG